MNSEHAGGGQATPANQSANRPAHRSTRLARTAILAVLVLAGLALVVGLNRAVVRAQTIKSQPFSEFKMMGGGSQIGITIRDVAASDVNREKLASTAGAVVDEVQSDSPAARAGMKAGDVIVSFDGEKIRSARQFARLVEETPDGREVEATVIRAGERVNLKVVPTAASEVPFGGLGLKQFQFSSPDSFTMTLPRFRQFEQFRNERGEFPADLLANRPLSFFGRLDRGRLGVGVQDLTGQLGEYFGASGGVLVTEVDENTPAKTAGIKAGDVITRINGEPVRDANDLRRRLSEASGETRLTVMRDRKEQTLTVKIEDEQVVNRQRIRR
jgi:serine protease Do